MLRVTVVKPGSSALRRIVPVRTGRRNAPRSSVTATNVLPVASCRAVMVTPGSTPPVESVTVPLIVASCAESSAGIARIAVIASRLLKNRKRGVFVIGPLLYVAEDLCSPDVQRTPRRVGGHTTPDHGYHTIFSGGGARYDWQMSVRDV